VVVPVGSSVAQPETTTKTKASNSQCPRLWRADNSGVAQILARMCPIQHPPAETNMLCGCPGPVPETREWRSGTTVPFLLCNTLRLTPLRRENLLAVLNETCALGKRGTFKPMRWRARAQSRPGQSGETLGLLLRQERVDSASCRLAKRATVVGIRLRPAARLSTATPRHSR
jgi:hypothetical protein